MMKRKKCISILLTVLLIISAATPTVAMAETADLIADDIAADTPIPEVVGEIEVVEEEEAVTEEEATPYEAEAPPEEVIAEETEVAEPSNEDGEAAPTEDDSTVAEEPSEEAEVPTEEGKASGSDAEPSKEDQSEPVKGDSEEETPAENPAEEAAEEAKTEGSKEADSKEEAAPVEESKGLEAPKEDSEVATEDSKENEEEPAKDDSKEEASEPSKEDQAEAVKEDSEKEEAPSKEETSEPSKESASEEKAAPAEESKEAEAPAKEDAKADSSKEAGSLEADTVKVSSNEGKDSKKNANSDVKEDTKAESKDSKDSEDKEVKDSIKDATEGITNYVPLMKIFTPIDGSILAYPLPKEALLTYGFGARSSFKTDNGAMASSFHEGIDLVLPAGTPVLAAEKGTIVRASWYDGYGNCVEVYHGNGMVTRYGHLSEINVRVGQEVVRGQQIGKVGNTGNSAGAHLHFEVRIDGKAVDPLPYLEESGLKDIDFASKRLIVKTDKAEALNDYPVIAELDGVYLVQFDTEEEAKAAFLRLYEEIGTVEVDSVMGIASGSIEGEPTESMTESENPFTEAEDALKETSKDAFDVAVIDTGATEADEIVSLIGDDGKDTNGHGQKMVDIIKFMAPDAKVLSIKAIGDGGVGDISTVYAAIEYAIEKDVKIINLSISALKTEDSFIVEEAIKEAISKGITVVGAAGNNGIDASLTIPGGIEEAIIVGASLGNASNYGKTVDYTVDVNTTSVAAAVVTGLTITGRIDAFDYEVTSGSSMSLDDAIKAVKASENFKTQEGDGNSILYTGYSAAQLYYSSYGYNGTYYMNQMVGYTDDDTPVDTVCLNPDITGMASFSKGSVYSTNVSEVTNQLLRKVMYYGHASTRSVEVKEEYYSKLGWKDVALEIGGSGGAAYIITHHATSKAYGYSGWNLLGAYTDRDLENQVAEMIEAVENLPDPPAEYTCYVAKRSYYQDYIYERMEPTGDTETSYAYVAKFVNADNKAQRAESDIDGDYVFEIYNASGESFDWKERTYEPGALIKKVTVTLMNGQKKANSGYVALPEGIELSVKEVSAPNGVELAGTGNSPAIENFTLTEENRSKATAYQIRCTDWIKFGWLQIEKKIDVPENMKANSDFSGDFKFTIHTVTWYVNNEDNPDGDPIQVEEGTEGAYHKYLGEINIHMDNGEVTKVSEPLRLPVTDVYVKEAEYPDWAKPLDLQKVTITENSTERRPVKLTITNQVSTADIQVIKKSAKEDVTDDNKQYSLKGAVFAVFSNKADADRAKPNNYEGLASLVGTVTTDEDGKSDTLQVEPDTKYYVKEIKAPKGFELSSETYESGQTVANKTTKVQVADMPNMDPIGILLQKRDKETGRDVRRVAL